MTAPALALPVPRRAAPARTVERAPGWWIDEVIAAALVVRSAAAWVGRARGEHVAVAATSAVTLAAAVAMGCALVRDLDSGALWTGLATVGWLLVAVLALVAARSVHTVATTRSVAFHVHGCLVGIGLDHEGGHRVMGEKVGGHVVDSWVMTVPGHPDRISHGLTRLRVPRSITPEQDAAIFYAGGTAAGTQWGCGSDNGGARTAIARGHRWGERGAADARARALAAATVGRGVFGGATATTRRGAAGVRVIRG